jgi:hypothetical protein
MKGHDVEEMRGETAVAGRVPGADGGKGFLAETAPQRGNV